MKITTVTSSCSRAIVHSDWIVYIAEPSASSASTGRSGQATAAPMATGRPWPIAPPVSVQPVVRRRAGGAGGQRQRPRSATRRRRSRPRAAVAPIAWQTVSAVSAPVGRSGRARLRARGCRPRRRARRPAPRALPSASSPGRREHVHLAAVGHQVALLAGVGEERHRRHGVDEHEVLEPGELQRRRARRGRRSARRAGSPAPRSSRVGKSRPEQLRAGAGGDPRGGQQRRLAQRASAEQQRRRLAATAAPWPPASTTSPATAARRRSRGSGGAGSRAVAPRHVGGQDQRGDLAGRAAARRRPPRPRRRPRSSVRCGRAHPAPTRCAPPSRCPTAAARRTAQWYVAWSPTMLTIGDAALARVVQVGEPVAEARPEVQQRARRAGRPCARSRRRRRWRRPRTARARRASRAPSRARRRSASRDVPGFVKHVVTPPSTSVRIRACAPLGISGPPSLGRCAVVVERRAVDARRSTSGR